MKTILLKASSWVTPSDFYEALLSELGAPAWHGENVNALVDSMIVGDINAVEPPIRVEVTGLRQIGDAAFDELILAFALLTKHGAVCHITEDSAWLEIA